MDILKVEGGVSLSGLVSVDGAKNAALPACVASLLSDEIVVLRNVPLLRDVSTILFTLGDLGKRVVRNDYGVAIGTDGPLADAANAYSVRKMRASFLVLGPLVARLGQATVPLPGGCAIGRRPVDLHLDGLRALGASVDERNGTVRVTAGSLRGACVDLAYPSVGATEQILMTASLAHGDSEIRNGAIEPEIADLVDLLRKMGAQIDVDGRTYHVSGRPELHGAEHTLIPDRMEAGTLLLAAATAGGEAGVDGAIAAHLMPLLETLDACGIGIEERGKTIRVSTGKALRPVSVETTPHPGLPTDLHPPLAAFLTRVAGTSRITETVFERRFTYVDDLRAMGAQIDVEGRTATIQGGRMLLAREVTAPDIRAGAALVLAGLSARGTTTVGGLQQIDRGYARLEVKLREMGARIERITV